MRKYRVTLTKQVRNSKREDSWVDLIFIQPASSQEEAEKASLSGNPGWTLSKIEEVAYFTEGYDHINQ